MLRFRGTDNFFTHEWLRVIRHAISKREGEIVVIPNRGLKQDASLYGMFIFSFPLPNRDSLFLNGRGIYHT